MSDADGHEPAQDQDQDIDSFSFEEAFRRLGEMAGCLEEGGLTLAEATTQYEQGMCLVRHCNKLLDEAELKITDLKDAYAVSQSTQDLLEEV